MEVAADGAAQARGVEAELARVLRPGGLALLLGAALPAAAQVGNQMQHLIDPLLKADFSTKIEKIQRNFSRFFRIPENIIW